MADRTFQSNGGGNSPFALGSAGFLPVSKTFITSGGSTEFGYSPTRFTMRNPATNRIYVGMNNDTGSPGSVSEQNRNLRVFKNDFGTYYQEFEIVTVNANLSDPTCTIVEITWATDQSYIYAIVRGQKTNKTIIDVFRYNLDGTGLVTTNIYSVASTTNTDHPLWRLSSSDESVGATCYAGKLYVLWSTYNGGLGTYQFFLREYTVSGTTYTLANSYLLSGGTAGENGRSLSYDPSTTTFYMAGMDNSDNVFSLIQKFTISGPNFLAGVSIQYPEFEYFNTKNNTGYSDGAWVTSIEFSGSSYTIYVIQNIVNYDTTSAGTSNVYTAYWLTNYTLPKV